MKFRKKPIVIQAEQYLGGGLGAIRIPGVCLCGGCTAHIHTLEGIMNVSDGDWVITGVKGEMYPCKPDIFAATYEKVE